MNVVELEQKRALLVQFAKGASTDPTLDQIQENTAGISKSIKALQESRGGLHKAQSVEKTLLQRAMEPASVISKTSIKEPKTTKRKTDAVLSERLLTAKKESLQKAIQPKKEGKSRNKKITFRDRKERYRPQKADQKPERKVPSAKEDLNVERRNKGFFKGIGSTIIESFKGLRSDDKRDKAVSDESEAKETGMLALLGPIAPAIQEIKSLTGERDEDEKSIAGKIIGKFRKKKPAEAEEDLKTKKETKSLSKKEGRSRDEKGRFISKGIQKAEESPEIIEKLDLIHDDLVTGEKDQKKRDKKQIKTIKGIESGGGPLGLMTKVVPIAVGAVATAVGAGMIFKDMHDIYKSYTEKDVKGEQKGIKNVAAEDVGGTVGGVSGAIAGGILGAKLGAIMGTVVPGIGNIVGAVGGGLLGAGLGAIGGNVLGEKVAEVVSEDAIGTLGKVASGIVRIIPVFGTAASIAIDAALIARDLLGERKKIVKLTPEKKAAAIEAGEKTALDPWMKKAAIAKERDLRGSTANLGKRTIPVSEDRNPKIAMKDKSDKKNLNQINASNENLVSESKKTNELLKKLLDKKGVAPIINREENIPNGISNQSDLIAMGGLDI